MLYRSSGVGPKDVKEDLHISCLRAGGAVENSAMEEGGTVV